MTKKYVETGACFLFKEHRFMLELEPETDKNSSGKIFLVDWEGETQTEIGTFFWGLDPFVYITREVMPQTLATVAVWKRDCKYLGKL